MQYCFKKKCNKNSPKRRVSDENEAKAAIGVHKWYCRAAAAAVLQWVGKVQRAIYLRFQQAKRKAIIVFDTAAAETKKRNRHFMALSGPSNERLSETRVPPSEVCLLRSLDKVKWTIFVQAKAQICIRKSRRGGLFVSVFNLSKKAEEKTRIPILKCKGFWTVINAHGKGKSRDDQVQSSA